MSHRSEILTQLKENFVFAVIRGGESKEAYKIAEHCIIGGIRNIEVTYTIPRASKIIYELSNQFQQDDIMIGAGTVLDSATANEAILAGAKFIVSPHFDIEISRVCNRYAIPYLPGCSSVTEIMTAMESGVDVVKLFPGGLLNTDFIRDVHGPIPFASMMPSGGVSINNIHDWIAAGAWAVGIGGALTKDISVQGFRSVQENAAEFINEVHKCFKC